jgi:GTP 3',8-cyclase
VVDSALSFLYGRGRLYNTLKNHNIQYPVISMEENPSRLVDPYHRRLTYLRISVTDRCNLRCLYCMPNEGVKWLKHEDILSYEEIIRVANVAAEMGVDKIRLTGGEPLVRKGIDDFLPRLTAIPGLRDVSLTTNGIYLSEHLRQIKSAGINRINISLDTLSPQKYERITGLDGFREVWGAIQLAYEMGFHPIKLNTVVLRGINEHEVPQFANLSKEYPFHIRFIEYMPGGFVDQGIALHHVPTPTLKERLSASDPLVPITRMDTDGPTTRFKFEGAPGEIGFISPLTHHFCETCNRLRLTAEGHLRPCLFSEQEVDLKKPLRKGSDDEDLKRVFLEAALKKPHRHTLSSEQPLSLAGRMSAIGG